MSAEDSQNSAGNVNAINDQLERLNVDGEAADATPRTEQEYAESQLTLRAIVSSKEAGVIIGKSGKNVADLRDETGVRAGVSKVVQGSSRPRALRHRQSLWHLQGIRPCCQRSA